MLLLFAQLLSVVGTRFQRLFRNLRSDADFWNRELLNACVSNMHDVNAMSDSLYKALDELE